MTDYALETIRGNLPKTVKMMGLNPQSPDWLKRIVGSDPFVTKKYQVTDFDLSICEDGDYKKVDFENSVLLFESLRHLPRHILTDERFWGWINFDKGYAAAMQAMPIKGKESTLRDHYLFTGGSRRGLFFGVLSRCYFRVELTYDDTLADKYELTRFVIENPERFRNLSWRAFSNQKHIVLGVLKAEKKATDQFGTKLTNDFFPEIAKAISRIGSVQLIDAFSEEEITDYTYKEIVKLLLSNKDNL
jgi:hypothetical protein